MELASVKRTISISLAALAVFVGIKVIINQYYYFVLNPDTFLSLHTILELLAIVISYSIVLQGWASFRYTRSSHSLLLCALFFAVGTFDLLHTLSFKGMPAFVTPNSLAKQTWFWLAARLTEAFFLALILFGPDTTINVKKQKKYYTPFIFSGIYTVIISFIIIYWHTQLPILVIEGQGVTNLKLFFEYLVCILHLATIGAMIYYYRQQIKSFYLTMILALVFISLGELIFTIYRYVYDIDNVLGHTYKLIGYFFLLKSIYLPNVSEPFARQQKAVQKLKSTQKYLDNFFNLSLDMLCIASLDGYFKHASPAIEKILGYSEKEIIETPILDLIHPEDQAATKDIIKTLQAGEPVALFRNRLRCRDGSYRWLSWDVNPLTDEGNIYAVARDITEHKKYEQEMARLDSLNIVGEMAATISHEVRNPLTTVRGFLQLLGSKKAYAEDKHYFTLMIDELDRANSIITEFLSIGRKNKQAQLEEQNLNDIIEALAPLIKADALANGKQVELELQEVPNLSLNGKEIRQVLLNLVRNGLEAMTQGGKVTISTYEKENQVVLAVRDEGPGIEPEVLEKIGVPFVTTKEQGTGLGLATCYSIVDRHNAKMEVDTSPNGTTFYIKFKQ